tara:strand:+ start:42 stop:425 length:384 start_codon:yes stop_codon:yes gene_type:complete
MDPNFAEQLRLLSTYPDNTNRIKNKSYKEGKVYIINNPAWKDWYKVGKAISIRERFKSFQTASPFRDFSLLYYISVYNRHKAENIAHKVAEKLCDERNNEWFYIKDIGMAKDKIKDTLDKKGMTIDG